MDVRCWGKSGLSADALLVRPGVGRDEGVVGDYLDKARVDADHRHADSLELGP
jgi:hypothetical protein